MQDAQHTANETESHRPQSTVPNKAQGSRAVYYVPVSYLHRLFLPCLCGVLLQLIDDGVRNYQKWPTALCMGHYISSLTVRVPSKHTLSSDITNILSHPLLITLDASYATLTPTFTPFVKIQDEFINSGLSHIWEQHQRLVVRDRAVMQSGKQPSGLFCCIRPR